MLKKTLIILAVLMFFFSCKEKTQYAIVEGVITHGSGERLFLEHNELRQTIILDSIDLNEHGQFHFQVVRPQYPDFYSLRITDKKIIFVVDSTENIIINGDNSRFTTQYSLANSPKSENIKELRESVIKLQNKINQLSKHTSSDEDYNTFLLEIENDIQNHKSFAKDIIVKSPRTFAAYFALFQKINNSYIFNPYDETDLPYWRAVATAFEVYMPEYERTENLKTIVLTAIKTIKEEKEEEKRQEAVNEIMKNATGYIDIVLPDRNENERKLSEQEGKVVLINFMTYEHKESVDYTFMLREIYNKYHTRGFEIYQVSLDRSKLLWDVSTESLPWVCVYDADAEKSRYASAYNVQNVPTSFLMDKEGNIIARNPAWDKLEHEITRLTKQ